MGGGLVEVGFIDVALPRGGCSGRGWGRGWWGGVGGEGLVEVGFIDVALP